jgi:hypothetical protein
MPKLRRQREPAPARDRVSTEPSLADVWAEIDAGQQLDALEPGERTMSEIAQAWGLSRQSAQCRVDSMIRGGQMTRRSVRIIVGGKLKHAFAYRPTTLPQAAGAGVRARNGGRACS